MDKGKSKGKPKIKKVKHKEEVAKSPEPIMKTHKSEVKNK